MDENIKDVSIPTRFNFFLSSSRPLSVEVSARRHLEDKARQWPSGPPKVRGFTLYRLDSVPVLQGSKIKNQTPRYFMETYPLSLYLSVCMA